MNRSAAHRLSRVPSFVLLAMLLANWPPLALAGEEPEVPVMTELDRRAGSGERCLVCGQEIHGDEVVEVRYKGRSFFVATKMLGDFEGDPDLYFQQLQAKSALFDERSMEGRQMSKGWLLFGVYVLVGLVFAAACGYLAITRALAPLPWFFAGLLGNVAALIVLLATPRGDSATLPAGVPSGLAKVPTTRAPMSCSACGGSNHPAAAVCGGCGTGLAPTIAPETARV